MEHQEEVWEEVGRQRDKEEEKGRKQASDIPDHQAIHKWEV